MPSLHDVRHRLDAVDRRLLEALAERQQLIDEVAAIKSETQHPARDPDRERVLLDRLNALATQMKVPLHLVETLYEQILDDSVRTQIDHLAGRTPARSRTLVAYQGGPGAYSERAAQRHFGSQSPTCVGFDSFEAAARSVEEGEADFALLPVENTTAGSITAVLDVLAETELTVVGEEVLPVVHCLLGTEEVPLSAIRRVISHPQALAQCRQFIDQMPNARADAFVDTALAARRVRDDADPAQVAIASAGAARRYGLTILARDLADQRANYTRFLALASARTHDPNEQVRWKTSLLFTTRDQPGALLACLRPLDRCGINLTKLESRPSPDQPWQYRFFVDVEGHPAMSGLEGALDEMREAAESFRVLGTYPAHVQR